MLGINCLLDSPVLRTEIRDAIRHEAYDLLSKGKSPNVRNVYRSLREQGLEVDLVTTTYLYGEAFASKGSNGFTLQKELEEIRGDVYRTRIEKKAAVMRRNEIGDAPPVDAVVNGLISLVQPDETLPPTAQKEMQNALGKAARRVLAERGALKPAEATAMPFEEILRTALRMETAQAFGQNGRLANSEKLWTEFQKEIGQVADKMQAENSYGAAELRNYADLLQQAGYDLLLSSGEARQVVNDVLKEAGLTKEITVQGKKKSVVDWNAVLRQGLDFRNTLRDVLEKKNFSEAEIARVVPFFEREYNRLSREKIAAYIQREKERTGRARFRSRPDVERLAALASMGAFQAQERDMIFDILGVDEITKEDLKTLEGLMLSYNQFLQTDQSKLSPTYYNTIETYIRNMVERVQERQAVKEAKGFGKIVNLRNVRYFAMYTQFQSASMLINVGNGLMENPSSGLAEIINTAFTNPRAFVNSAKTFGSVFMDVLRGGVEQGENLGNLYQHKTDLLSRTSYELSQKTLGDKLKFAVTAFQRALLSAMDAATKAFLWRSMETYGLLANLQAQGLTASEAYKVLNETYYGNQDEVNKVAQKMVSDIQSMNIGVSDKKASRIAGELAAANMLTDGQFFKGVIARLEATGAIRQGVGQAIQIDKALLLSIRAAANGAAARGVGHQQDLRIFDWLDRKVIQASGSNKKARGDFQKQAGVEMGAVGLSMLNRFRIGALKWTLLNFEKSSGIALLGTIIFDIMANKSRGGQKQELIDIAPFGLPIYSGKEKLAERLKALNDLKLAGNKQDYVDAYKEFSNDLEAGFALRQRLSREAIQPLVSYALFKYGLWPVLKNLFGCKGDDKQCQERIMLEAKKKGWDTQLSKVVPVAAFQYWSSLVKKDKFGNVSLNKNTSDGAFANYLATFPFAGNSFNNTMQFATSSISTEPLYRLFEDLKNAKNADEQAGVVGRFVGSTLNLAGVLKMMDINKRYFNVLEGETNRKTTAENKLLKPQSLKDGFYRELLLEEWYRTYKKNNR